MARGERMKLETGKAYAVTLKYVDFTVSQEYGDEQIRVTGQWDGVGLGHTYLPHGAVEAFLKCGAVESTGKDSEGRPQYPVVKGNRNVVITRRAGDGNSKITDVALANGRAPAASTAAPGGGSPSAAAPSTGPSPTPAGPAGRMPVVTDVGKARLAWKYQDEAIRAATAMAAHDLAEALGCAKNDLDQQAVVSLTATILIRAENYNLPVAMGMTKKKEVAATSAPRQPAGVGAGAGLDEEDDDVPF